ncbi:MAG: hypothetical protein ACOYPS_07470, partial [Phycisphaerales bacterium]
MRRLQLACVLMGGWTACAFADVVVTFDEGGQGWSIAGCTTIDPAGGNPGANLHCRVQSFASVGAGITADSPFTGDLTRHGAQITWSIDLKVNELLENGQPAPRFFSVELFSHRPERDVPWASIRHVFGSIAHPFDTPSWTRKTITVVIPSDDSLPTGWIGVGDFDEWRQPRLPPGWTASDIFRDVDHCSFSTQGPWPLPPNRLIVCDLQIDNIRISGSNRPGCPPCIADHNRDGGVDGADVQAFFLDWEASLTCADSNEDGGVDAMDVAT